MTLDDIPLTFTAPSSTAIDQVTYVPSAKKLYIKLTTDRRYVYADVPPSRYMAFFRSTSRGRYYNRYIKGKYVARQVMPDGSHQLESRSTVLGIPAQVWADLTVGGEVSDLPANVHDISNPKYDQYRGVSRFDYEIERQGGLWAKHLAKHRRQSNANVIKDLRGGRGRRR